MHNTDYNINLRQAKQNSAKNKLLNATSVYSTQNSGTNPLLTVAAVVLILVAIFQMDPANAEPTMDIGGYGTLQLMDADQLIRATTVNSYVNMIIEDDQLSMIIDQSFSNHTRQVLPGEYRLIVPSNASISASYTHIEHNDKTQSTWRDASHNVRRIKDQLLIQTPALAPNQRISVHLKITYQNNSPIVPETQLDSLLVSGIKPDASYNVVAATDTIDSLAN